MSQLPDPSSSRSCPTSRCGPCTERDPGARRRPPGGGHPARQRLRQVRDAARPGTCSSSSARSRAPTGSAAQVARDRAGLPVHRARPARRRRTAAPAGRCRATRTTWRPACPASSRPETCPQHLGEAGGLGGRRGRHGGHPDPPVPGVADRRPSPGDELRGLFLFEALRDDQLDWIAEHGRHRAGAGGHPGVRRGLPGRPASSCCSPARSRCPARSAGTSWRPPAPTSAACTPAPPRPTSDDGSQALLPQFAARGHRRDAAGAARRRVRRGAAGVVPDGDPPAGGALPRVCRPARRWSPSGSAWWRSARCRRG